MTPVEKTKMDLTKKYEKVLGTPASFAFFEAIHDFVACVESQPVLVKSLSDRLKANQELNIGKKYLFLKQVYQGFEDIAIQSKKDLGHDRYSVIRDLNRIKNKETTDTNAFWKRRELLRNSTGDIYRRLSESFTTAKK